MLRSNNFLIFALSLLAAMAFSPIANAQSGSRSTFGSGSGGSGFAGGPQGFSNGNFSRGGASTAQGSILQGQAQLTRSRGQYAESLGRTAVLVEQARSAYIQNRLNAQQASIESVRARTARQLAIEENKRQRREFHISPETIRRIHDARLPNRLSDAEIDRFTGEIMWPGSLMSASYRGHRTKLDSLFMMLAEKKSSDPFPTHAQVTAAVQDLREQIASEVRSQNISTSDFAVARRFLSGLRYEAHLMQFEPNQNDNRSNSPSNDLMSVTMRN